MDRIKKLLDQPTAVIALFLVSVSLVFFIYHNILPFFNQIGRDFPHFYLSSFLAGHKLSLYDNDLSRSVSFALGLNGSALPYLYPPFFAVLIGPLTWLTPVSAFNAWLLLNLVFLLLIFYLIFRLLGLKDQENYFFLVVLGCLLFIYYPLKHGLELGQTNLLVYVPLLGCFLANRKGRPVLAGLLLATACLLKISPAIFLVYFLWRREYQTVGATLIWLVLINLIMIFLAGWNNHLIFFSRVLPGFFYGHHRILGRSWIFSEGNISLNSFLAKIIAVHKLPGGGLLLRWGTFAISLGLAGSLFLNLKRKTGTPLEENCQLSYMIFLMILLSRVTWEHHLVWLIFPFFVAAQYYLKHRQDLSLLKLAALPLAYLIVALDYPMPGYVPDDVFHPNMFYRLGGLLLLFLIFWDISRRQLRPLGGRSLTGQAAES